jgi:diacylglycerol kinase
MKKRIHSFRHAINGLSKSFQTETNLQIHFLALAIVTALGLYFSISIFEWLTILLISALVISLELMNTAIEKMADFIEPKRNGTIKIIKDTTAAAVLVAAAFAAIIAIIIFYPYFFTQL